VTEQGTKRCPGYAPEPPSASDYYQPAHELAATLENFNSNKGNPDGLSTRCRACGNAYGKAWSAKQRAIRKADLMEVGIERDRALDAAYALPPRKASKAAKAAPVAEVELAPDPVAIEAVQAEQAAPAVDAEVPDGWALSTIAGKRYLIPASQEAVASEEGQQALDRANEARKAQARDQKRAERARKAQEAAPAQA